MKIMITYPPLSRDKGVPTLSQNRQFQHFSNATYFYPVILSTAATLLKREGFQVSWKDAIAEEMPWEKYQEFFRKEAPDLAAIETKTPVVKQHWEIIKKLKALSPKTKFVLMGDHVTAKPEESLDRCRELDYVLTGGDYDFLLLELANSLKNKTKPPKGIWYMKGGIISSSGKFELTHSLDTLPFPDRELTKHNLYQKEYNIPVRPYAYIMSGRDCPWGRCRFCAWTTLFPKFRVRSPENVLDEIGMLIEKYKVKEVFDDTGTFPPGAWLREFCEGMVSRGYHKKIKLSCNMRVDYITEESASLMKKANFRLLKIGLESANQKTLDRINKNIRAEQIARACKIAKKQGLSIHLTMIIGYPWETKEDADRTFKLAKRLMISGLADVLQSTVLVPYPGTPLYQEGLREKWFRFSPGEYERYDMTEPVFNTPGMTPQEVMDICNKVYRIFLSPKYVLKHMKKIKSFSDIKYTMGGAKAVLGHLKDFSRKD